METSAVPVKKKRLGEILIEAGLINETQLEKALIRQQTEKKRLGRTLVDMNILTDLDICQALSTQLQIAVVDYSILENIDRGVLELIPRDVAFKNLVLPLSVKQRKITIVISDPLNLGAIQDVEFITTKEVDLLLAPESKLLELIEAAYGTDVTAEMMMKNLISSDEIEVVPEASGDELDESRLVASTDAPPVVRLVSLLMSDGVNSRASDIHLEPKESHTVVRYRIDGEMRNIMTIPGNMHQSVISRIKVMANMDISERRKPLDGGTKIKVGGRVIDLRLSTLPSLYGERMVMRILDPDRAFVPLNSLGLNPTELDLFNALISYPQGMVLITGPTGSGKTTLLYAAIDTLKTEEVNLITLEDPIEYRLPGISQVQVNEKVGLTFASGLRSILRQDPDIVMVGEIRDLETSEIAFRASQTGHLVLATLHTNDAVATVTRLYDLKLPHYLIGSSVLGIVAQRLVRRICDHCQVEDNPDLTKVHALNMPVIETFYKGEGCEKCNFSGYHGRVGIYEVVPFDAELKEMVGRGAGEAELTNALRKKKIKRMIDYAWEKLQAGVTTLDEILAKIPWAPSSGAMDDPQETHMIQEKSGSASVPSVPFVLVVDSDPESGKETVKTMRSKKLDCGIATNGREGLKAVYQKRPDLVFLSSRLQDMSGFDMLEVLRKKLETSKIPVIVLSNSSSFEDQKRAYELGAHEYLVKPVDPELLLKEGAAALGILEGQVMNSGIL